MAKIKTGVGVYHYSIKPLYVGRKKIDKQIAKENLLDFNSLAIKYKLKFGLAYGTLLGAVRESDFIAVSYTHLDVYKRQVIYCAKSFDVAIFCFLVIFIII